jgi:uncharacterized membrane protein YphA (DoxX/SURF4 family)
MQDSETLQKRITMNNLLWILQGFLAIIFGYSGLMKSSQNREHLVDIGQTGVANLSYPLIRSIGVSELLGTLGIILPWATGIMPALTPITAFCFALLMVLAAPIHYKRKEYKAVALNLSFLLISTFVAVMRFSQLGS